MKIGIYKLLFSFAIGVCTIDVNAQETAETLRYTLNDCMKYALEHNQGVKKQQYTNDSYKQDYYNAIAAYAPGIGGNIGAVMSYGRSIDPATNTYTTTGNLSNSYSISASMPVFAGFTCFNNLRMTRAMQLMGVSRLQQIKDELALNTMKAYFNLLFCRSEVDFAMDQLSASKITLSRTAKENELGLKSEADLAQIESQVASDELLLIQKQNNADMALLSLKQQMNFPLNDSLQVETDINKYECLTAADSMAVGDLIDFALVNNPRMQASNFNVRQSKYSYYYYIGRYFPSLYVGGGYSTNYYKNLKSVNTTDPFWNQIRDNRGYYFQASVSIPIFNNLSRRSAANKYRNSYKIAMEENSETERAIQTEIAQTVMEMKGYDKEYEQASKKVEAALLSHKAAVQKFEIGTLDPIQLQTSANLLLQAKSQQLNARLQYIVRTRLVEYYNGEPLVR